MGSVNVTVRIGNPTKPGDAAPPGLTGLEELGVAVDPVRRRLVPGKFLLY